jgi:hypothetical protein
MSTDLIEGTNGVYLTRFYGGEKRGVCYQLATKDDSGDYKYLQFTDSQMDDICLSYRASREEMLANRKAIVEKVCGS